MHWSYLFFLSYHYLLAEQFIFLLPASVSDGEKSQPLFVKIATAEIGNIPSKFIVDNFRTFTICSFPFKGRPVSPFRYHEFLNREKVLRISNYCIYFTSFHNIP